MKRKKYVLLLLIALTTLLAGCRQQSISKQTQPNATADVPSVRAQKSSAPDGEAIIQDLTDVYRICTTRPQRLLPTQAAKNQRTSGKQPHTLRWTFHQLLTQNAWTAVSAHRAPLPFVAPRSYYIIALRRIIR